MYGPPFQITLINRPLIEECECTSSSYGYSIDWSYIPQGGYGFTPPSSVEINTNKIRINFWDSDNCSGLNKNPDINLRKISQRASVSGDLYLDKESTIVFNFKGRVERHNSEFDKLWVSVNDSNVLFAKGWNQSLGCEMSDSPQTDKDNALIVLPSGNHKINITTNTMDGLYHTGAYYEVSIDFRDLSPLNISGCCQDFRIYDLEEVNTGIWSISSSGVDPIDIEYSTCCETQLTEQELDFRRRNITVRAVCKDKCGKEHIKTISFGDSMSGVVYSCIDWIPIANNISGINTIEFSSIYDCDNKYRIDVQGFLARINTGASDFIKLPASSVYECRLYHSIPSTGISTDYLLNLVKNGVNGVDFVTIPSGQRIEYTGYSPSHSGIIFIPTLVVDENDLEHYPPIGSPINKPYGAFKFHGYGSNGEVGNSYEDKDKLINILSFGPGFRITHSGHAFENCVNLRTVAADLDLDIEGRGYFGRPTTLYTDIPGGPSLNPINMEYTFKGCTSFTGFTSPQLKSILPSKNKRPGVIDFSRVVNTSFMFSECHSLGNLLEPKPPTFYNEGPSVLLEERLLSAEGGQVGNWDVSNVTNMNYMFDNSNFNGNVDGQKLVLVDGDIMTQAGWDVSKVQTMAWMFADATRFIPNISYWNPTSLTNAGNFLGGTGFNAHPGENEQEKRIHAANTLDKIYRKWPTLNLKRDVPISFGVRNFSQASIGNYDEVSIGSKNFLEGGGGQTNLFNMYFGIDEALTGYDYAYYKSFIMTNKGSLPTPLPISQYLHFYVGDAGIVLFQDFINALINNREPLIKKCVMVDELHGLSGIFKIEKVDLNNNVNPGSLYKIRRKIENVGQGSLEDIIYDPNIHNAPQAIAYDGFGWNIVDDGPYLFPQSYFTDLITSETNYDRCGSGPYGKFEGNMSFDPYVPDDWYWKMVFQGINYNNTYTNPPEDSVRVTNFKVDVDENGYEITGLPVGWTAAGCGPDHICIEVPGCSKNPVDVLYPKLRIFSYENIPECNIDIDFRIYKSLGLDILGTNC